MMMVISGLAVFAILATAVALIGDFDSANLFDIAPTDAAGRAPSCHSAGTVFGRRCLLACGCSWR
ncbi:hypothetical protein HAALTHF_00580n [Vreelandella aquamarina]|nr:hypothetical protein HAALTHF_00580n [Halomonas axialensis]